MINDPWDIPPKPKYGDRSERITHTAVGYASSRWEGVEVEFAHLYALLSGRGRFDLQGNRTYGAPNSFTGRIAALRQCAGRHFTTYPDQWLEAEFDVLVNQAIGFADRRNDIIHTIVRPIQWLALRNRRAGTTQLPPLEWCLVPPHFRNDEFTREVLPKYILTAKEIDNFSEHFHRLQIAVHDFSIKIEETRRGA